MTPLSRVVHSLVAAGCIVSISSIANAQQSFHISDMEVTGSADVRYGHEIWVIQNMESHKVLDVQQWIDVVETGPPMYLYQWSFSTFYYPSEQVEGVFIKVYWKEGTGDWTYLKDVNGEVGD